MAGVRELAGDLAQGQGRRKVTADRSRFSHAVLAHNWPGCQEEGTFTADFLSDIVVKADGSLRSYLFACLRSSVVTPLLYFKQVFA